MKMKSYLIKNKYSGIGTHKMKYAFGDFVDEGIAASYDKHKFYAILLVNNIIFYDNWITYINFLLV